MRPGFLSTTQLPYDGLLQSPEKFAEVLRETDMDVLSEVLKVVKLQGAMFYNGEFSAPWSFRSPASCNVAPFVAAGAEHVIIYHLLTEGHASAHVEGGDRLSLDAGDVVIFPHGDPHTIENGRPMKSVDLSQELARIFSHGLRLVRSDGGGDVTKFVCGYMACEPRLSQVFLSGLPPVFKVSIRNDASGRWLENSIRFSVDQADAPGRGRGCSGKAVGGLVCRNTAAVHCASATGTDWLAGQRPRSGSRKNARVDAPQASPSVDDRHFGSRSWSITFGTGRALPALPQ